MSIAHLIPAYAIVLMSGKATDTAILILTITGYSRPRVDGIPLSAYPVMHISPQLNMKGFAYD